MDFVIIANAWSAGTDNPTSKHQIALELARQGHRVLWLEGAGMRRPSLGSGADRGRIARKLRAACRGARRVEFRRLETGDWRPETEGGIWVLAPLLLPFPKRACVRALNGWLYRTLARAWSRRLGLRDPVLINYVPVLAEAMKGWGRREAGDRKLETGDRKQKTEGEDVRRRVSVVYHCVDRWDAFEMYDSALMADMDARCCRYADLVVASSRDLYERCRERNPRTRLLAHGVDHTHFAGALTEEAAGRPADMPEGRIAGFFGLLSEWVDQGLLLRVAREAPDCQVVLIGRADVPVDALRREPRIRLLGPKPFAQMPRYVGCFDVGLIPFVVSDLTRAVNPIKLREMLAAGCPVVSTALPEVEQYARPVAAEEGERPRLAVTVTGTADAFVRAVGEAVQRPCTPAVRREISRGVANETWSAKVAELVEWILMTNTDASRPLGCWGLIRSDLRAKAQWVYGEVTRRSLIQALCTDGTFAMIVYRWMQSCQRLGLSPLAMFFNKANTIFGGCVIGRGAQFGPGFVLIHSMGVVINSSVRGGRDVKLEHQVTIGAERNASPVLGDDVFVGAGARIVGGVRVGNRAKIGANAVVVDDVPDGATAVGVPARLVGSV